ncbi:MAG: hypothetical protein M3P18_03350, partial [Actinomycetota bacterium]|nr:hypothetical protein [Actinomycetota bacterium]
RDGGRRSTARRDRVTPGVLAQLLLQVVAALAVGWVVGDWFLRRLLSSADPEAASGLGLPERALISLVAFFGFCVAEMVVNLVTGGAVFGLPGIVCAVAAAIVISGVRRRGWPVGVPWRPLALFVIVLFALYVAPVIVGGSGARLGDPAWHLGWTEQLLHGEPIPTGPAPEFARNAYPWGFHALLATLVRLVPGSNPLVAYDAAGVLFLLGLPLAAASLARRLRRDAGWPAAIAVSLVGGFGWLSARGLAFAASPSEAHHGADLVVASPNAVYELFPPALPRELGVVTLAAATLLFALAAAAARRSSDHDRWSRSVSFRLALAAGAAGGITGLISVPLFVTFLAWSAAGAAAATRRHRVRLWSTVLAGALPTLGLWAGPVIGDYLRFGGFVSVTPHVGTEWTLAAGIASWGLLGPAAIAGVLLSVRERQRSAVLLACGAASAALMGLAIARAAFGWRLSGNETLLYQGRVWPPAHLLGAAFAGAAAAAGYSWLRHRMRVAAVGLAVAASLIGAASPALASVRLTHLLATNGKGFIYGSPDFAPGGFVRRAAAHLGPSDVVSVHGSQILKFSLFSFSGVRLANYDDPTLASNDLRIRFSDLARRWDRRMADRGFDANFRVVPATEAGAGAPVVARGLYEGIVYVLLRS